MLATLVDLVQRDGLGELDDDQLTGVLQAANRLAAWAASVRVAAVSGLAGRRERSGRESGDWRPFDHVDDEVAAALTLTRRSAARLLDLALGLDRLPLTRAALAAGAIDERRAGVIAEEVAGLDDEHAAAVEKLVIGRAPGLASGQLRALVRRAVLSADPKAARRRKEAALKDARVELFPEVSGTAALAGRDLPPAAVLAADKHLTALAQAMKAAGIAGTLDILRARAYLHLLSGQPAATLLPATTTPGSRPLAGTRPQETPHGPDTGLPSPAAPGPGTPGTPWPPADGPATAGLRGSVNLTMPLSAWLGWTQSPGDVPGYGPLDAEDSRALAGQLAQSPASQWCVTLTGTGGAPASLRKTTSSALGDDGGDRQPVPALCLPGQIGSQPAGERLGQGGHDDFVEMVIGEHLLDGLERAGAAEGAVHRDALRGEAGRHLAEPLPGLSGRLLVGGRWRVVRHPPPHARLGQNGTHRHGVVVCRLRVRDQHEERAGPLADPLAELVLQLSPVQGLVRDHEVPAHADHPPHGVPRGQERPQHHHGRSPAARFLSSTMAPPRAVGKRRKSHTALQRLPGALLPAG